ncbi:MAG: lytic transglycosylase domain-containing protein, partial [Polyangiaceae bacterium]
VAPPCSLVGYAKLRSAQALTRAGKFPEAIAHVRLMPADIAAADEGKITFAEATASAGDRAQAVPVWRELLASNPHGTRWVDTAIRLGTALVDGVEGTPEPNAREALALSLRVITEAPKFAESSGAQLLRTRALAMLGTTTDPGLTLALRTRQLQGWLDANEPAKALSEANSLMIGWPAGRSGALPCKVTTYRAQATARTRAPASDAWRDAIAACVGDEDLVGALYHGGKSAAGKHPQEAIDRFAKVEAQFPHHRLADDARFQSALISKDLGDEARFTSMLNALPNDYPEGDMRTEALFRVALLRMTKGDWVGAKDPLDRSLAIDPNDRHWATSARAAYFRARASAMTGDPADASRRYLKIIEDYPFTFYMTQAFARVASSDLALAERTMDGAMNREAGAGSPFLTHEHPEFQKPEFERAVRLLEVAEIDAAKRELTRLGVFAEGADNEAIWVIADLYNRAGAPDVGHSFTRTRLHDHLPHYPVGAWRLPWEVAYPPAFQAFVMKESESNSISPALTWAIMREESSFIADVKSPANAFGLMQLIVPTAKLVAVGTGLPWDAESLKRPDVNVALGTRLLGQLRGSFGNRELAIPAYNAGAGAVNRWVTARGGEDFDLFVEEIPYEETRGYIKRVLSTEAAYAFLYARSALKEVLTIPTRVAVIEASR